MSAPNGSQSAVRPRQPRAAGMPQQERLRTEADHVGTAVERTGLRQASTFPIQEILGAEGQFGSEGEGTGNLVARNEQFLGFGTGRCCCLGQVEGRLAIAQRVHGIEYRLAPEHVVLAGLDTELGVVAHLGVVEHEGIEDFAGRPAVVALGIVAQVRAAENGRCRRTSAKPGDRRKFIVAVHERVGVRTGIFISLVVPTRGADTKAHLALVDHIQFGQQVDTVGDVGAGLAEVVITVVAVGRPQNALVGTLRTHAIVVLDSVVETNGPVFAARIQLDSVGGRQGRGQDSGSEQLAPRAEIATLHRVIHLYCFCCGLPSDLAANDG
ncbi:hypothetical protein D3C84_376000 [compost metagenome]